MENCRNVMSPLEKTNRRGDSSSLLSLSLVLAGQLIGALAFHLGPMFSEPTCHSKHWELCSPSRMLHVLTSRMLQMMKQMLQMMKWLPFPKDYHLYKVYKIMLDVARPSNRYVHFDFHHVCGGGNFDNLQALYNQIEEAIQKQGYFVINSKGEIILEQTGVIRSNCIDCLDRTNVTQSFLARKSLDLQLQRMGALSSSESISVSDNINDIFKKLWVEHGDEISLEYAGSYALKGDLVRYGKQTLPGLIKDGMSALSRYYLNNFHDGVRQDALDLISGYYTVSQGGSSPFHTGGFESASYLPVASAVIVGGITGDNFHSQSSWTECTTLHLLHDLRGLDSGSSSLGESQWKTVLL